MEQKTPLMQQYADIKRHHKETLLFFQVGDFYELFYDDAISASRALGITLTSRGKSKTGTSIPLCGVPVHTAEFYIKKLLDQGFKVALCNQQGEAKPGILVERSVDCIFTPGTLVESAYLKEKKPSYLVSVTNSEDAFGLVVIELIAGTILCTSIEEKNERLLHTEITRFFPDEIVISDHLAETISYLKEQRFFVSPFKYEPTNTQEWLHQQKIVRSDKTFSEHAIHQAIEQLYSYLQYTNPKSLHQSYTISYYAPEEYLIVDTNTQANLDVFSSSHDKQHSLFHILDNCVTPMGSRMLKKWLSFPLNQRHTIEQRLQIVNYFFQHYSDLTHVRKILEHIGDFERIVGRIALDKASVADYQSIAQVISYITPFFNFIAPLYDQALLIPLSRIAECQQLEKLRELLIAALYDNQTTDSIIRNGYSKELDELRSITHDVRKKIVELEQYEQQKTGIATLKIRQSQLHGYYIEVTLSHIQKIPSSYKRLQSLSGKERYTNDDLDTLARKIDHATKNVSIVEQELFNQIKLETISYLSLLRQLSFLFSYTDVVTTYAYNAHQYSYVMPTLNENGIISITAGRHPVVERIIAQNFIPNSVELNNNNFFVVLTGPNMGGKSTYLRQIALIALMAHTGSFIPALSANIMILDRIFTRIGAGDNLAEGKSTFLVEMEEVATICHHASQKSLVVLDEVGRGTSTNDGIAIAHALLEYLCNKKPRCLFATHYQELAYLENKYAGVSSYCVESKKEKDRIVFLYTVVPGIASQSFGIEVAKIAQLPSEIIQRATELLQSELTIHQRTNIDKEKVIQIEKIIDKAEKKYKILQDVNLDTITPKQALDLLFQIRESEM